MLVLLYELSIVIFRLDGLSILKIVVTVFIWLSVGISINQFFKNFKKLSNSIPQRAFYILCLLIIWNLINIGRSLYIETGQIKTLFGNINTSLALLLPFLIVFSIKIANLKKINSYFFTLIKIGIILFILFFVFSGGSLNIVHITILNAFFLPVIFLITTFRFEKNSKKLIILIVTFLLSYVAYIYGSRTMIIRQLLLIIGLIPLYLYRKFHFKWVLKGTFILILLPFILIQYSINTGESAIQKYTSGVSSGSEMSQDTRTFLYLEVYEDLAVNKQLLFGKGAGGTYYSNYFSKAEGDSDSRLTVEVGVLAILLKTGLIGVILYLLLIFASIFYAFFRSNNYYVVGIGLMLFIYVLLLFIENAISYSGNSLFIWFFIGVCLSKEIRNMSNLEIKFILN